MQLISVVEIPNLLNIEGIFDVLAHIDEISNQTFIIIAVLRRSV